jgi:hypothetical protein
MQKVFLAIVIAAFAVPAVAQADPPLIVPAQAGDSVDTTSCDFPVAVHFTANGQTAKIFSSGRVIVTGPLAAEFSANGKTVSLNIAGPATITEAPDGSVTIIGRGVGAGPFQTPNGVTLAYAAGPVSVSPTGDPYVLLHGTIRLDICAALAP